MKLKNITLDTFIQQGPNILAPSRRPQGGWERIFGNFYWGGGARRENFFGSAQNVLGNLDLLPGGREVFFGKK